MAIKQLPVVFCHECGHPFFRTQVTKIYCSGKCRQDAWNRRITGGFKLYELAMRWRIDRPKSGISDLCVVADQLADDERTIRKRRDATIARERKEHPGGILPSTFEPGKTVSENLKLPPGQRHAMIAAATYCLAMANGKKPNDPAETPEGWDKRKLAFLTHALATLTGSVSEEETEAA